MSVLQRAVLELDADVDSDGSKETGVFEMVGNIEIEQDIAPQFLLATGQGSSVNAIISQTAEFLRDEGSNPPAIDKPQQRAGFYIDLGGGRHSFRLNFIGWEGATDGDGNDVTWGDPGETEGTAANMTGQDPMSQMQCLMEYLRIGQYDSRAENARLRVGEYNDGTYSSGSGVYDDYIHVTFEGTNVVRTTEDPNIFNGSLILVEAESLQDPIDTLLIPEW